MSVRATPPLPDNLVGRAALFRQLAAVENAGIASLQALLTLQREATPALRTRIEQTRQYLLAGSEPGDALFRSGLCQSWENQFLQAMHRGGRLGEGYAYLARQLDVRALRMGKLKARLALPAAVFVLALFIAPLPALVRGSIDGWGYFARTLLPLALLVLCVKLLGLALRRDEDAAIRMGMYIPVLGALLHRQQELHCLAVLGLLLRSGLPADQALKFSAVAGVAWPPAAVKCGVQALASGDSLASVLSANGLCSDTHDRALIAAGEASGKLDDAIERIARMRQAELDLKLDLWSEWLPRVLYFGMIVPWLL